MAYPLSPAIPSCRLPEVSHDGKTAALPLSTAAGEKCATVARDGADELGVGTALEVVAVPVVDARRHLRAPGVSIKEMNELLVLSIHSWKSIVSANSEIS